MLTREQILVDKIEKYVRFLDEKNVPHFFLDPILRDITEIVKEVGIEVFVRSVKRVRGCDKCDATAMCPSFLMCKVVMRKKKVEVKRESLECEKGQKMKIEWMGD